jgi:NTP pyrophosphatase (non-canonical NTP hydrolase)
MMSENQAKKGGVVDHLARYQREAWRYDQHPGNPEKGLVIALLGLGGEVGTLQTTQKKVVRDNDGHLDSRTSAVEDLGDILWYVADAATWLGVDLGDVADDNLKKIARRWSAHDLPFPEVSGTPPFGAVPVPVASSTSALGPAYLFDGAFDASERLPRQLTIHLAEIAGKDHRVLPVWDDVACGNQLGDNAYDEDGYRWHDCFHLAHLAVLGWSPVFRALLKRKRKSVPRVDDVEDGGRAVAVEEGITAMAFEAATRAGHFERVRVVDSDVLRTCIRMAAGQEVNVCTPLEWERAILLGYDTWRVVRDAGHGAVTCDLDARTIEVRPLTGPELARHAAVATAFLAKQAEARG